MRAQDIDLSKILKFLPEEGRLLLGDQRLMLFSQQAFSTLRHLMVEHLGAELAQSILIKFGYRNGSEDYETLSKMFAWTSESERLAAGPMMHSWSGIVKVEPTFMEMDRRSGHFHFKGLWKNSYEAEIHLQRFGLSPTPVCYTLTGYGSGWCSAFFGIPLLEIETKCVGCGDSHCEWEIRPLDAWGKIAEPWRRSLQATTVSIHKALEESRRSLADLNTNLENEVRRRTEENKNLVRLLCHDFATPLDIVKAAFRTFATANEENEFFEAANQAITHMDETLEHVRVMQRASSGKERLELRAVDPVPILQQATLLFRNQIQRKNISIELQLPRPGDVRLLLDPASFRNHILNNIISNAIKFTPAGGRIGIHLHIAASEACIEISDNGIGIPHTLLAKVFDPVQKTSRPGTNAEPGSGFGLPLVKTYMDLHHARINIDTSDMQNPAQRGTSVKLFFKTIREGAVLA